MVSLGDVEACVSFRGDLGSRPRGATRALSWGLDLADFEAVPIKLTGFEVENAVMLWSVFMRCAEFNALQPNSLSDSPKLSCCHELFIGGTFDVLLRRSNARVRRREILTVIQSQLVSVAISFLRNFGLFSGASGILGLLSSGVAGIAGDRW